VNLYLSVLSKEPMLDEIEDLSKPTNNSGIRENYPLQVFAKNSHKLIFHFMLQICRPVAQW
jgi:hypothetical protein